MSSVFSVMENAQEPTLQNENLAPFLSHLLGNLDILVILLTKQNISDIL